MISVGLAAYIGVNVGFITYFLIKDIVIVVRNACRNTTVSKTPDVVTL